MCAAYPITLACRAFAGVAVATRVDVRGADATASPSPPSARVSLVGCAQADVHASLGTSCSGGGLRAALVIVFLTCMLCLVSHVRCYKDHFTFPVGLLGLVLVASLVVAMHDALLSRSSRPRSRCQPPRVSRQHLECEQKKTCAEVAPQPRWCMRSLQVDRRMLARCSLGHLRGSYMSPFPRVAKVVDGRPSPKNTSTLAGPASMLPVLWSEHACRLLTAVHHTAEE